MQEAFLTFLDEISSSTIKLRKALGETVPEPEPEPEIPELEKFLVHKDETLSFNPDSPRYEINKNSFNIFGKSFAVSLKMTLEADAYQIAPVNMTSFEGSQWIVAVPSNGMLKFIAMKPGGGDMTMEIPVDNLLNRQVHLVVSYNRNSKILVAWVDKSIKNSMECPNGVGYSPDFTAPLRYNENSSGFNMGKFTINEFRYYVGHAAIYKDVERLYGVDSVKDGFKVFTE